MTRSQRRSQQDIGRHRNEFQTLYQFDRMLVSDVVLSSVAGDETSESSVSVTSESSESVTSESVASESVASESVTAVSDISDLYTTSERYPLVTVTQVLSYAISEQRSSIPIMSSSDESSESRESSVVQFLSEENSDSSPTTFSTRYWSPSGMSSRHYTNSTEMLVSDVVLSSVAGDKLVNQVFRLLVNRVNQLPVNQLPVNQLLL